MSPKSATSTSFLLISRHLCWCPLKEQKIRISWAKRVAVEWDSRTGTGSQPFHPVLFKIPLRQSLKSFRGVKLKPASKRVIPVLLEIPPSTMHSPWQSLRSFRGENLKSTSTKRVNLVLLEIPAVLDSGSCSCWTVSEVSKVEMITQWVAGKWQPWRIYSSEELR